MAVPGYERHSTADLLSEICKNNVPPKAKSFPAGLPSERGAVYHCRFIN